MLGSVNGAVVIGGYNADLVTVASVECFDADTGKWTELPPLTAPRYDFSACVLPRRGSERERLVVAGGTDDTSAWLKSAEVFNGKVWSLLPAMSMQRDRCGACVLPSGQVAVLGGSPTQPAPRRISTTSWADGNGTSRCLRRRPRASARRAAW